MADFGLRAAGRAPESGRRPFLLSDAMFNPPTLRRGDADIRYRAKQLQIGRVVLTDLAAKGTLEQGVLTVAPLTAGILAGKLRSHGRLDARTDVPKASADIDIPICSSPRSPARTRTRPRLRRPACSASESQSPAWASPSIKSLPVRTGPSRPRPAGNRPGLARGDDGVDCADWA